MNRLREKLEDDPGHPQLLQTVWGVGTIGWQFKLC